MGVEKSKGRGGDIILSNWREREDRNVDVADSNGDESEFAG